MSDPFPYKKILIIGATSGIGQALATRFLENNISIVAVGRRQDRLDTFVSTHAPKPPSQATISTHPFDITALTSIPSFASEIFQSHPDIDAVYINSGIQKPQDWTKPHELSLPDIDIEVLTNYTSYLHLTAAFLPYLQARAPNPAAIIYTSSGLALVPNFLVPNYSATKAALHHHCLSLRAQLRASPGNNVRVVEIFPPAVKTELHDYQGEEKGRSFGMDLGEFVDETWEGLRKGEEQVFVELARTFMAGGGLDKEGSWERTRQEVFGQLTERMRGGMH